MKKPYAKRVLAPLVKPEPSSIYLWFMGLNKAIRETKNNRRISPAKKRKTLYKLIIMREEFNTIKDLV